MMGVAVAVAAVAIAVVVGGRASLGSEDVGVGTGVAVGVPANGSAGSPWHAPSAKTIAPSKSTGAMIATRRAKQRSCLLTSSIAEPYMLSFCSADSPSPQQSCQSETSDPEAPVNREALTSHTSCNSRTLRRRSTGSCGPGITADVQDRTQLSRASASRINDIAFRFVLYRSLIFIWLSLTLLTRPYYVGKVILLNVRSSKWIGRT